MGMWGFSLKSDRWEWSSHSSIYSSIDLASNSPRSCTVWSGMIWSDLVFSFPSMSSEESTLLYPLASQTEVTGWQAECNGDNDDNDDNQVIDS